MADGDLAQNGEANEGVGAVVPGTAAVGGAPVVGGDGNSSNSTPVYQASPAGGMVATLLPGQAGFNDLIKAESDRKDGFVTQDNLQRVGEGSLSAEEIVKPVVKTTGKVSLEAEAGGIVPTMSVGKGTPSEKLAPATVRSFKVGQQRSAAAPKKWLFPAVFAGLVVIVAGAWGLISYQKSLEQPATLPPVPEKIVLDYWGLWEANEVLREQLRYFEELYPNVSVNYTKKNINGYRNELQAALASQNGPDVFRYHASWRSSLDEQLAVVPATALSQVDIGIEFYPVYGSQLKDKAGQLKGIPLMYDSLALIYNKEIFEDAGVEAPKSWPEFRALAARLTIRDEEDGHLIQAGAAMGLASNVDFALDIVGLLAVQQGAVMSNPDIGIMQEVLTYYTDYYLHSDLRVWDETFANSTQAFASGDVAMILAPSWLIHDIFILNPDLPVGVASAPQLDVTRPVDWATYWVEGVNAQKGDNQKVAAWNLLKFLSSSEVLAALNQEQEVLRSFGEIYPRRSMADQLAQNAYTQPYLVNAVNAVGYPYNDKTFDGAINDSNKAILNEVVGEIAKNGGKDVARVTEDLVETWLANLIEYKYNDPPAR